MCCAPSRFPVVQVEFNILYAGSACHDFFQSGTIEVHAHNPACSPFGGSNNPSAVQECDSRD